MTKKRTKTKLAKVIHKNLNLDFIVAHKITSIFAKKDFANDLDDDDILTDITGLLINSNIDFKKITVLDTWVDDDIVAWFGGRHRTDLIINNIRLMPLILSGFGDMKVID